jgi:hypothetical protein
MRRFPILLAATVLWSIGCGPAEGQSPPTTAQLTGFGNDIAARLKLEPLDDKELLDDAVRRDVALLQAWLANTSEVAIHQIGDASENKVYLSKDGHSEAVFDGAGKVVTDPVNEASYNYAHPHLDPLGHFAVDILPWIEFGSSPNDPSTKRARRDAYLKDLRSGLHRVATGPIPVLEGNFNWRDLRRDVPVRLFRQALHRGKQRLSDVLPAESEDAEKLDAWFDTFSDAFSEVLMESSAQLPSKP